MGDHSGEFSELDDVHIDSVARWNQMEFNAKRGHVCIAPNA
ncbi:hypothetical protein RSSM_04179 [Rhodopirellula sallentina SM41]|uniref:Uncharacterized protein n=1 Tax=Rhodopirellula sallentina SM41 TaxID=1263870 RepID=M5TZA4_9BACT|nr:hypothetical protein RSSM_04179 [Rhodopirellula sallentina SM41]